MNNIDYFRYRIGKTRGCIIYIPLCSGKDRYFSLGLNHIRYKIYKKLELGLSYVDFKTFINEAPF